MNTYHDNAYLELLRHIKAHGVKKSDRTGTGTQSCFGYQNRYDLSLAFPLLTTKKMFTRGIITELLWFLRGDTNAKWLQDRKVGIWDEWATKELCARFGREENDLGPIYGHQWRNFGATKNPDGSYALDGVDQVAQLIEQIKKNPDSRRHIITGWNPKEADEVALPPCHTLFHFYVADEKLSCQLYQRSADVFLGVPFNIASYALLTHMVAHMTGLGVGDFVHTFGDVHIYLNHIDQVNLQLSREPFPSPVLKIKRQVPSIFDFEVEDFEFVGYQSHPKIDAPIAV